MILSVWLYVFLGLIFASLMALLVNVWNGLVSLRQQVDRAWANIDVVLEQRNEEIPKLIAICEQFVKYESDTIHNLVESRLRYIAATQTKEKVAAANSIASDLNIIMGIGESYPQLLSNSQFVHLQNRISELENQIAARKETVNDTITNFNIRCRQFPEFFFAIPLGYSVMELYKVPIKTDA